MKEKLIKYWERKEESIERYPAGGRNFFAQAFGALEFAMAEVNDWDAENVLIELWNNEWKDRLEAKVYGL
jgi:hypothetical protein